MLDPKDNDKRHLEYLRRLEQRGLLEYKCLPGEEVVRDRKSVTAWCTKKPGTMMGEKPRQCRVLSRKDAARKKLRSAVMKGLVEKHACWVCGDESSEAHHADYDNPLGVVWLCKVHHAECHTGSARAIILRGIG